MAYPVPIRDDQTVLYIVRVVDKTVKNDEYAYNEFYVRADNPLEAQVRAILRHGITEDTLNDFDIDVEQKFVVSKVEQKFVVSKVDEDAD